MYSRPVIILVLLLLSGASSPAQEKLNVSDSKGLKQGHWIKKDAGGHTVYDGWFVNNYPEGPMRRYHSNDTIQSVLVYSENGTKASATFYHPNGFIASKGLYVNQKREGKWQFYSSKTRDYLICEENYSGNRRNGLSVKYYSNHDISEKLTYTDDIKNGEWFQYYLGGQVCLRAKYINGKLEGPFEIFFDNGKPEFTGQYSDDVRDGTWLSYNRDGTVKNKIDYVKGKATNPELSKAETEYLDNIEKNKGKISDPEITGSLW